MPVVGGGSYNSALDAAILARALCNDQSGSLFSDSYLLPFLNAAYRNTQIALANAGKQSFTEDYVILSIPAVTAVDPGLDVEVAFTGISGNVTPANTPALPGDLIEPLELQERLTGSTDLFRPINNMTAHGGLPSLPQDGALRYWEWRGDALCFIGSTQANDVRLRYRKGFAGFAVTNATGTVNTSGNLVTWATAQQFDSSGTWVGQTILIANVPYTIAIVSSNTTLTLTASAGTQTGVAYSGPNTVSGTIQVLDSLNAIGYLTAALALTPRGSPLADKYAQAAEDYTDKLINTEARAQQHSVRRRRPFSSRGRMRTIGW